MSDNGFLRQFRCDNFVQTELIRLFSKTGKTLKMYCALAEAVGGTKQHRKVGTKWHSNSGQQVSTYFWRIQTKSI